MMEKMQRLLLSALDSKGSISDTRTLLDEDGNGLNSSENQTALQRALSSLESRQVDLRNQVYNNGLTDLFNSDDRVQET